jgi:thiol-disulfide isomerase/thioredoxin
VSCAALLLLAALAQAAQSAASAGEPKPAPAVADFLLESTSGAKVRLEEEVPGRTLTVVAFTAVGCPITKLLAPRLGRLEREYREKGVRFLGVDPNIQDGRDEIATFAKDAQVDFPILLDPQHVVTDRLGVTRTTEVFVLDAEFHLLYRGAVDDQYSVGAQKPAPQNDFLVDAIESGLAGETIGTPRTDAPGCLIGRVAGEDAAITFWHDVAPILWKNCVECHRANQPGPMELLTYDDAVGWAPTIAEVTGAGRMPPWHADPRIGHWKNARALTDTDRTILARWSAGGAKEGERAAAQTPPTFADPEWAIGKPDLVVALPNDEAVPAEGVVPYRYVVVDPQLDHDVWVQKIEVRPGNRAVTHHVISFLVPPGMSPNQVLNDPEAGLGGAHFAGNAPGGRPIVLADGHGKLVRAGSKFLFQLHYTPNGKATTDRTRMALVFSKVPVTVESQTYAIIDFGIDIAPYDGDATFTAEHLFKKPITLTALMPHMHLRGKSFRFELVRADGTRSTLLDVPSYDFNWQHTYALAQPLPIASGDRLKITASFDNSKGNKANPNPAQRVRWGDQTFDEMMVGYIGFDREVKGDAAARGAGSE